MDDQNTIAKLYWTNYVLSGKLSFDTVNLNYPTTGKYNNRKVSALMQFWDCGLVLCSAKTVLVGFAS